MLEGLLIYRVTGPVENIATGKEIKVMLAKSLWNEVVSV